jgi:YD repeat-containing protein
LVNLIEDPDVVNYETDYSYTALDQLTQVAQGGQTRSFYYDSLGRLTRAVNPETGEICYGTGRGTGVAANDCIGGYDGNGNLLAKRDGRGYATTMTYDALNRPLTKTYSTNASTPNVTWTWDTVRGGSLSSVATSGATVSYGSYDALGKATSSTQAVTAYPCGGQDACSVIRMTKRAD